MLLAVLAVGVFGIVGQAGTTSAFTDEQIGNASFSAATSLDGTPDGPLAYDDENRNGVYDSGEVTYSSSDLVSFDDPTVALVIPSDVDDVSAGNTNVSIEAASIRSSVDISGSHGVSLAATDGDVTVTGTKVESRNGPVTINSSGHLNVSSATVNADAGDLELRAKSITARNAGIESKNHKVLVSATRNGGGQVSASGAVIKAEQDATLESVGDMTYDDGTLQAKNGHLTANLGTTDATLHVTGTKIKDIDNTLVYDPDGATVVPAGRNGVSP